MIRASIAGASGYTGGELLRLLLAHPQVEVAQVTSERSAGAFVHFTHANLRGVTRLKFVTIGELEPCDVLFLGLPHGGAMESIERFAAIGGRVIDLSADFRLRDPALYERWYGHPHTAPAWLGRFVYGLPELHRESLRAATHVSGVGCNATATNLAVWPLYAAGLVRQDAPLICEVKVGSSEGGNKFSESTHHPERSGAVRSYAPTGHRHTAEVLQALGALGPPPRVHLSATAVELVRGVLATAHVFVRDGVSEREIWQAYRKAWGNEPFVRLVKERTGIYRAPEPKILAGSNWADVGFELEEDGGRLVAICAIDNLMKGAAGTAVQCLNLMMGWEERLGLEFPGLHPI